MEMYLGISIEKIEASIRLANERTDNILAFGELWFFEENQTEPFIKVKGFTIKSKEFKGVKTITTDFPAFRSRKSRTGFQTSFVFENIKLVEDVRKMFLNEFNQASGGLSAVNAGELVGDRLNGNLDEEEIEKISKAIDEENPQA